MTPATAITISAADRRAARKQALPAWLKAATALLCGVATCQALAAPVTIDYSGGLQTFTVQTTGTYTISAAGAQGGYWGPSRNIGRGAEVFGDFVLTAGTVLNIIVGGMGYSGTDVGTGFYAGGGGGGSFIYTALADELLLVAGGGGGSAVGSQSSTPGGTASVGTTAGSGKSRSPGASPGGAGGVAGGGGAGGAGSDTGGGGGGAGWTGNGSNGADGSNSGNGQGGAGGHGPSDFAGGAGAALGGRGGFGGGGGGGQISGGGGGGYSGGGGGGAVGGGGGGSSFFADYAVNTGGTAGTRSGNGYVSFDLVLAADPNAVPEPGTLLLAMSALGALALLRRRRV